MPPCINATISIIKNLQHDIPKMRAGSKAVWSFSKKSSDLVAGSFPKGNNTPKRFVFLKETTLWKAICRQQNGCPSKSDKKHHMQRILREQDLNLWSTESCASYLELVRLTIFSNYIVSQPPTIYFFAKIDVFTNLANYNIYLFGNWWEKFSAIFNFSQEQHILQGLFVAITTPPVQLWEHGDVCIDFI